MPGQLQGVGSQMATPHVQMCQPAREGLPAQQVRYVAVRKAELLERFQPCEGALAGVCGKVHPPEGQTCQPSKAA